MQHTVKILAPNPPASFRHAVRVNHSLTASSEKRLLQWLAQHAPSWLTSDQLTLLGFTAQIGAGVLYACSRYQHLMLWGVIACIMLNWLGDSLDGTLARVRRQQRPRFGFYVDHMVDVLGSVALMVGLATSGFLHWQVALAMLLGFLLLSCESYLATYTLSQFQLSQGLFGPTELRLLLIAGNLALLHNPYATLFGHQMLLFDVGGCISVIGMAYLTLATTVRHTLRLYREEPLP